MNKKNIVKKIVYYLSSVLALFSNKKLNNVNFKIDTILKNHPLFEKDTFNNNFVFEKVDLCCVVPFFNVKQEFIDDCLLSLINQKTKYSYKIICINDGSIDNTKEKIQKYVDIYPNKIMMISQENGGISRARNKGISYANCDYIGFIDQDDWVDELYIEKLLNIAKKNNIDIVKCSHSVYKNDKKISTFALKDDLINHEIGIKVFEYSGMIWSGIYRRNIFDKIRFPIEYWYEDMISRFLIYRMGNSFASISESLYCKRKHENNASITIWQKENVKCIDHLYLVENLTFYSMDLNKFDKVTCKNLMNELGAFFLWRIKNLPKKIQKSAFYEASEFINKIKIDISLFSKLELQIYDSYINKKFKKWKYLSWKQWSIIKE